MSDPNPIDIVNAIGSNLNNLLTTVTEANTKRLTRVLQACNDSPDSAALKQLFEVEARIAEQQLKVAEAILNNQLSTLNKRIGELTQAIKESH